MSVSDILNNFINAPANQPYPIHQYAFISPVDIPFTKEVRAACEANLCGRYGKSWACPPGAGDWEELRDHYKNYKNALVYTTKHDLEDSFDIEGMDEGRIQHEKLDQTVLGLLENEKEPFELLGAGSCSLCEKCTYPDAPCRFPQKAKRSMEACGIDVVSLSKSCGINYTNGANTVTYFSVIYF